MNKIRLSGCIAPFFYAVHDDIRARRHSEYALSGGRGSCKSSFAALEIVLGLLRNREVNAIVYRRVASSLRESAYEQIIWAIDRLKVRRYFTFSLVPMEITLRATGQKILFRGADDPAKSKSLKLAKGHFGFLWFEELTDFSSLQDVRTIKAGIARGGRCVTLYTFNPPLSRRHWVNRMLLEGGDELFHHHSTYLDVPRAWLGESFLAEAERTRKRNERVYRWMYMGESVGGGGAVFENLQLRPVSEAEKQSGRAFCGLDFGFAVDPDAFVRAVYDVRRRTVYLTDEFYAVRTPAKRLCEEIDVRAEGAVVRCDSAEPRMIHTLRACGVRAIAAKKGPGSVESGLRWLQERAAIVVDPARCPNAARELALYEYARDKEGRAVAAYPDCDNHAIDALRYALEELSDARSAATRGRL